MTEHSRYTRYELLLCVTCSGQLSRYERYTPLEGVTNVTLTELVPMPLSLSGGRGVGGGYAFALCGMGQRSLQRLNPARIKFWFADHKSRPSVAIPPKYRASAPSISSEYSHNSTSKSINSPLGPLKCDSNISSYTAHASSDGGCAWTDAPHNTANVNAINLMAIAFLMEGDKT
jgi:hypothetical protein